MDSPLGKILSEILKRITGPEGKVLCLLIISGAGIGFWFQMVGKKTLLGLVGGVFLVFGASWIAKNIFGIDAPIQ
jgi:type IV secretory pathway VirB2 component (pilin)